MPGREIFKRDARRLLGGKHPFERAQADAARANCSILGVTSELSLVHVDRGADGQDHYLLEGSTRQNRESLRSIRR